MDALISLRNIEKNYQMGEGEQSVVTQALRVELDGKRRLWLEGKQLVLEDLVLELKRRSEALKGLRTAPKPLTDRKKARDR